MTRRVDRHFLPRYPPANRDSLYTQSISRGFRADFEQISSANDRDPAAEEPLGAHRGIIANFLRSDE